MPVAAVITADIVNSTLLTNSKTGKKMIAQMNEVLSDHKFEFFRGDSLQVYIKDPREALNIVFRLRAVARSFSSQHDVRASIGIGQVEAPVRTLKTNAGEAFVLSGRSFDYLTEDQRLWIESFNPKANLALRGISYFADYLFRKLSAKQAIVIAELLKSHTQVETAKRLKKAQPTINKHARAAGWTDMSKLPRLYDEVINQFEML